MLERLAAYEDSGLTPEEIGDMKTAYDENQEPYMIEATGSEAVHIYNLLLAEAQGRLMVLPCKIGDTIYLVVTKRPRVTLPEYSFIKKSRLTEHNFFRVAREFGKTVFLTREEAEVALGGGADHGDQSDLG